MKKEFWIYISLVLVIILFSYFYVDMILSLPLFGDAATHGYISNSILQNGVMNTTPMGYPPIYFIFQDILKSIYGEKGFNLAVILGILFISLSTFLLIREITGKSLLGLVAIIIVLASSKIIFYSSRMYMEILLCGYFVFCVFLLLKYLKNKSYTNLIILSIFVGVTCVIKQQGILILFVSIVFFWIFSIIFFRKGIKEKISIQSLIIFILIVIFISSAPYLVLLHNDGQIAPGIDSYKIGNETNLLGQKITGYQQNPKDLLIQKIWGPRLNEIQNEYYENGTSRAELKHIWPWTPFISFEGFTEINSLYLANFWNSKTSKLMEYSFIILLLSGIIIFIINIIYKNKILNFGNLNLQIYFLVFLLIFLAVNYIFFLKNTDQMRYHLFIPIILTIFILTGVYLIYLYLRKLNILNFKFLIIIVIILILINTFVLLTYHDTSNDKRWSTSQIYSPSVGGIDSVKEAGYWIENNTQYDETFWQPCWSEIAYYSNRKFIGSPWIYFLKEDEIKQIFNDWNISYAVIFDSQIVPDDNWGNLCWIPESFSNEMKKDYPQVYETSYKDIKIYKLK